MIFGRYLHPSLLNEAEGDDATNTQQNTQQQAQSADNTDTNNTQNTTTDDTQQTDTNAGEDNQDQNDTGGDDEFNIDADMDIDTGGEDNDGETTGGDTGGGSSASPEEEEPVDNKDTRRDKELFDSLSPQEQKEKNIQLKKLYFELYSNCDYVIDKLNNISDADMEEYGVQVRKILSVLFDLKQMISDYAMKLYDSKSYIENDIMFNRYLSILNTVKNITSDIRKSYKSEEDSQGSSK